MTRKSKRKTQSDVNTNDMLTEEQFLGIATLNAKQSGQMPRLTVKNHEGIQQAVPDHEFLEGGKFLVMNGLGIDDSDFYNALMTQFAAACVVNGKIDENALNDTLSMIKSNGPRMRDWMALCNAMAAVVRKNMALALILASSKDRRQQDRVRRLFVKSTRTVMAQLECLKRRRTVGVSQVRIQKGSGRKRHAGGPRRQRGTVPT